jgi:hypothetical protein
MVQNGKLYRPKDEDEDGNFLGRALYGKEKEFEVI